ITCLSDINSK
nr:RecName: Full=Thaumatin-like protein 3 [Taxus baccata]